MSKEALKLALEALEMFCEHGAMLRPIETRDAVKEALAQPEQSPAWYHAECDDPDHSGFFKEAIDAVTQVNEHGGFVTQLYTAPPQPKEPEQLGVDLAPTDFHVFSKAGTSNVTPKGKKK